MCYSFVFLFIHSWFCSTSKCPAEGDNDLTVKDKNRKDIGKFFKSHKMGECLVKC